MVVIPFTLCSLLLCNDMIGERARVAQSGMSLHPCRPRPLGASLRLAPALRKRFGDLQPAQGIALSLKSFLKCCYCFWLKMLWGFTAPA